LLGKESEVSAALSKLNLCCKGCLFLEVMEANVYLFLHLFESSLQLQVA
jgi:hypothetical protein